MFRSSGSVLCVVVMAAFVFGCGGGGGGTTPDPEPPVVTPVPPTDAERIAEAREAVATILANARTRASGASSALSSLQTNTDATDDQRARAGNHNTAAQDALSDIVSANNAAQAATTPAAAQTALTNAQTAQSTLNTEASAISSIQSAVQLVTNAREQREADQLALTGGSSLIQHLRDNKLLADAVLGMAGTKLTVNSIVVDEAGATTRNENDTEVCTVATCATFAANTGTGTTRVTGQRMVEVVDGLISDSTTPALSGRGRLPHGFDQKNTDGTNYVNAYTDISQTKLNVTNRRRPNVVNDVLHEVDAEEGVTEEMMDVADTDYLLAGIWMQVNNTDLSMSSITAFAYGSQAIPSAPMNFCLDGEVAGATNGITRACTSTTLNSINSFVDDGKDLEATYTGNANGTYLAGSDTRYFTGDVTLTAEFRNPSAGSATDGRGSIEGEVTGIKVGGQDMAGSIELQKYSFTDHTIHAAWAGTTADPLDAVGVVDGKSFIGQWKGQFFGYRVTRSTGTETTNADANPVERTITTTYSAQAPGSVAGTFYATQQSNPEGEAAFIGAFGAHR